MNDRDWAKELFLADIIGNDQEMDHGQVQDEQQNVAVVVEFECDCETEDSSDDEVDDASVEGSENNDTDEDYEGAGLFADDESVKVSTPEATEETDRWKAHRLKMVGKRLAYLLRYGAQKEGLKLHFGDYVLLDELLAHRLMRWHPRDEVLHEVDISISHRGYKRFETMTRGGLVYIRACFGRKMDRNPCHAGSQVKRLLDQCLSVISVNLDMYDLHDFPDEFTIMLLLNKLRRQKRLNNSTLKSLLCPVIEKLDLEGVYLTESTLRTVTSQCPNLTFLSLRKCGYIITDHTFSGLIRKLPQLEVLNLAGCSHLTDKSLSSLAKLANLRKLNICDLNLLSEKAILNFMERSPSLRFLDIHDFEFDRMDLVAALARKKGIKVILKGLKDKDIVPDNAAAVRLEFSLTG